MKIKKIIAVTMALFMCTGTAYGHSGRTDKNGGHRDKNNVSGLGPYHYHCGGYPAHLHPNGVCPYKSSGSSSTPKASAKSSTSTPAQTNPNKNNVYLIHTMPQMTVGESYVNEAVSNNTSASLSWSSSNTSVATVDYTGKVTAVGVGTAIITVSNGYKSASYTLTCKGYVAYTSVKAEINGKGIQLYKYNNDYYVLCNDLNSYGFDTAYDKYKGIVKITRNKTKAVTPLNVVGYAEGKIAYVANPTSINVLCGNNTNYSKAVNGDGRMFVAFNSLATFGNVSYDNGISLKTF